MMKVLIKQIYYWRMYGDSSTERFHVRTIPNGTLGSDGYLTFLETVNVGSESQLKLLTAELQAVTRGTRLGDFCSVANAPDIVQFGNVTDLVNTFIHTGIILIPAPTPLGASFWATSGTHRFGVYYDIHAPYNVQMDVIAKAVTSNSIGSTESFECYMQGRNVDDTTSYIRLQNGTSINNLSVPA